MVAEGVTPKADGDIFYATEANWALGFGDGTDGAFSENSGTTNLVQGTVYQYTTFLLDTNATLSASSTSKKPIVIYVQGNCTINGTVDLAGKGMAAADNSYGDGSPANGDTVFSTFGTNVGTVGLSASSSAGKEGGRKGMTLWNFQLSQNSFIMNGTAGGKGIATGGHGGGGGGASSATDGTAGSAGSGSGSNGATQDGGSGGCTIIIKIGGTLTFGASSTVDVSGANGANAASDAGGSGGGASGDILIFHRGSKTDSGVTTDVTGGTGGTAAGTGGAGGAGAAGTDLTADWATILWD